VLPAVTGLLLSQGMRGIFTVAIGAALAAALVGFSLSVPLDLPSGPTIITVSGVIALAAWGVRRAFRL
jgi:ABC-type Mn2+/Zn2+ transport system permease subunit